MIQIKTTLSCDKCKTKYRQVLESDEHDQVVRLRHMAERDGWQVLVDTANVVWEDFCPNCKPAFLL